MDLTIYFTTKTRIFTKLWSQKREKISISLNLGLNINFKVAYSTHAP